MTTVITVNANLEWRAQRGDDAGWVAFCDALGLATEAETLDELHSLIPEAIHLLLIDLFEDNELDAFLKTRGWQTTQVQAASNDDYPVRVPPWQLSVAGGNGSARAPH
jgi:predicted RNase H-like HicB family nuclease